MLQWVRIEQIVPRSEKQLKDVLKKYKGAKLVWTQEEPLNMGYWSFIQRMMPDEKFRALPARRAHHRQRVTSKVHKIEQEKIVNQAFEI